MPLSLSLFKPFFFFFLICDKSIKFPPLSGIPSTRFHPEPFCRRSFLVRVAMWYFPLSQQLHMASFCSCLGCSTNSDFPGENACHAQTAHSYFITAFACQKGLQYRDEGVEERRGKGGEKGKKRMPDHRYREEEEMSGLRKELSKKVDLCGKRKLLFGGDD